VSPAEVPRLPQGQVGHPRQTLVIQIGVTRRLDIRSLRMATRVRRTDKGGARFVRDARAQVAELVDALVSGTSDASRGGSSPLLGTICI
jgi:hypothetical protein